MTKIGLEYLFVKLGPEVAYVYCNPCLSALWKIDLNVI